MEAKNPCMGCLNIKLDYCGYLCDVACGKRTAWLNYMAGIREVVEWINEHGLHLQWKSYLIYEDWQAKLKEWGLE